MTGRMGGADRLTGEHDHRARLVEVRDVDVPHQASIATVAAHVVEVVVVAGLLEDA
ncbi:hypothetical protein [Mumia flava]|uniref:hypothetical protein n=1 Tax=Mumia flava TaxID=1348852 RepID=UPI0012FDFE17|nr:hypothetical protein [Mumia flava]